MSSESLITRRARLLLIASFLLFLVKSLDYLLIGGYVPAAVFALFSGLVLWGAGRGGTAFRRTVRIWAVAITLWALARFGLLAMFTWTSVSEAAIEANFGILYVAISAAILIAGLYLFRHAPDLVAEPSRRGEAPLS